jgi:translation initiation factor 4G
MANNPQETITFRKLLLNRCQHEFETDQKEEGAIARMQIEIDSATSDEQRRQLVEEMELAESTARRRSLGNIRFIGELFKLKMLTEGIMHDCVLRLLRSRDEDSLECLCGLLKTIGSDLDHAKSRSQVDSYFSRINAIISKHKISTRLKFMLQDVVELRNTNWIPRHDDNKPKTIQEIHSEAAAEEEQKTAMLQRVASSPAIADRHSRQQRAMAPGSFTSVATGAMEDSWKAAAVAAAAASSRNPPRMRVTRLPTDDPVQLGPHGRSMWQSGSSGGGGRRTPSLECDRPLRFHASGSKADDAVVHIRSASGAREMARQTSEKDRNDALAAVRNIAGNNPPSSHGPTPSTSRQTSSDPVEQVRQKLSGPELEKRALSILEEYLDLHDLQEAVACFRELGSSDGLGQFVSQAANFALEKSSEARRLTGVLLHQLIAVKLLTVEELVHGLKEVFSCVEDIEIDVPKIWFYLAELICPMVQRGGSLPLNFLYQAAMSVRMSRKVSSLVVYVLQDAAHRLGFPVVAELWHASGLQWSMFVPVSEINDFLHANNLMWIENAASCQSRHETLNTSEGVMAELHELIVKPSFDSCSVLAWIRDNVDASHVQSVQFVRGLTKAVCAAAVLEGENHRYEVNKEEVKRRAGVLVTYVGEDGDRQLQAVYAVQAFVHQLQHPPDVLRNLFDVLYDEDVISEETFRHWKTTNDPAEPGKGVAITSVIRFFTWLDEAGTS